MIRISVDFPAPFSPTRACTSPASRSKLAALSARTPAKLLLIPAARNRSLDIGLDHHTAMCFNSCLITAQADSIYQALDAFRIELPSWGFANTGTRFGKFLQPAAAATIEEKFSDAGQVHHWTGVCPTLALHVLWDLPGGIADASQVQTLAAKHGLRPGSINPNTFQDQVYKYGSLGNPDPAVRKQALDHILASIEIGGRLASRDVSLWFADGSNYPGTQNIRRRRQWFAEIGRAHV